MFGRLEIAFAGRTLGPRDLGGIKPRQLLEVLLLDRGRPVSTDRIADCLWGERPPVSPPATIETYVSQLRRILGRPVIRTETGGYRVPADAVASDLDAFDALVQRAAATTGERRRAALRSALDLAAADLLAERALRALGDRAARALPHPPPAGAARAGRVLPGAGAG
jgi:DNA-binding SARP family transcriptional activator